MPPTPEASRQEAAIRRHPAGEIGARARSDSGVGQAREVAQRCAAGSGGPQALTSVGTSDVRDLDVLRAALGDEQLSYLT